MNICRVTKCDGCGDDTACVALGSYWLCFKCLSSYRDALIVWVQAKAREMLS